MRPLAVVLIALAAPLAAADNARVLLETSKGPITVELLADAAPLSAANFVDYVESGFYDGLVFHRVIPGFVIQGGGLTRDMQRRETRAPIENEADNGLRNLRGTLSMARTQNPHSASSQFFINLEDNASLDHTAPTVRGWGYAVFGRVLDGLDVVDAIAATPTGIVAGARDMPLSPVVIERARVLNGPD